jgi:predicted unusual protein kinase regulating ubiquinone biosynthesis (AarF/ABC1/UbiB family)
MMHQLRRSIGSIYRNVGRIHHQRVIQSITQQRMFHVTSMRNRWDAAAHGKHLERMKQEERKNSVSYDNDDNQQQYSNNTNQQQSEQEEPASTLPIWIGYSLLIIIAGGATITYLKPELNKMQSGDGNERNEFMFRSGNESELYNAVDEFDAYHSERWYDRLWRWIRLSFRICQLSIIFTPAILFYWIQAYICPKYYYLWCMLLVKSLELAGPCFIKLGQWAATRPDLFSDEFCEYLSSLHAQAPYHHFRHTKLMIKNAFGKTIPELFDEFNEKPLASGAIAQVHKARLKGRDGYCAVKVRHPRVAERIQRDLAIIDLVANIIERFETFAWLNLRENVASFSKNMKAQANLNLEAQSLRKFIKNFRFIPSITFPHPIMHGNEVLIESFEEGLPVNHYINHNYPKELKNTIASIGTHMYLKMMFVDNMVHADLHPGNLKVRMTDNGPLLVVLDAGLTSSLSPNDRRNFIDLFSAILGGDSEAAASLMIERGKSGYLVTKDPEKVANFKKEMAELIQYVMDRPLGELEVGTILQRALQLGRKYQVLLESNFTTLVIGTIVIEGLGRRLNPEFNFIQAARPYLQNEKQVRSAYVLRNVKRYNAGKLME